MDLSVLVRSSDDPRLKACLNSIDAPCDIVVTLTPDPLVEQELSRLGIRYALSPKGNPAATTLAGLGLCRFPIVLLVDSDCTFLPGAIERMYRLAENADIVRPTIEFQVIDRSSYLTRLARDYQYTCCDYVYEPGLLVRLDRVLPYVGDYLFTPLAPFTPDGELDYRLERAGLKTRLRIVTDPETTIIHAALSFRKHLYSYWRYGCSEASRMLFLKQEVLSEVLNGLIARHRLAWSELYPPLTGMIIAVCDIVYIGTMIYYYCFFRLGGRSRFLHISDGNKAQY
jgi:hypothetical protein